MKKDIWIIIGLLVFIFSIVTFAVWHEKNEYIEGYTECKDVGGEYQVIDKEYSIARKTTVKIYGCVKP